MASLGFTLPAATAIGLGRGRGRRPGPGVALASKGAAAGAKAEAEEKGLFDWILGGLQKDEQLLETDPILNKVSLKSKPPAAAAAAPRTNGGGFAGFGGLFAKK